MDLKNFISLLEQCRCLIGLNETKSTKTEDFKEVEKKIKNRNKRDDIVHGFQEYTS